MVPRKLIETAFRHKWVLVAAVLLVPALALALSSKPARYQSQAVLWVTEPPDQSTLIGHSDPYRTPAQNQALTIGDLLTTSSFRVAVAQRAEVIPPDAPPGVARAIARNINVWAGSAGQNLLNIGAISASPEESQRLAQAVIDEYSARAAEQAQQNLTASVEYFREQLTIAQQELDLRQKALSDYLLANPRAVDPQRAVDDVQYQTLRTRVETQGQVVESLSGKLQDNELRLATANSGRGASITVQDPPSLPGAALPQSITSRLGMPFAGLVFGLLIGATYLYVRFRSDHSIISAEDLAGLPVPMLGSVPELRPAGIVHSLPVVGPITRIRQRGFARSTARDIGVTPLELEEVH